MTPREEDPLASLNAFLNGPLRVVVIDDDPDTVLVLLALLRDEGYLAEGFASAKAAMPAIELLRPDVVISDVSMPGMSGWDLARHIRKILGERPTLIGISGFYTRGPDKALAGVAGFNFYFTKPYDPQELLAILAPLANNGP